MGKDLGWNSRPVWRGATQVAIINNSGWVKVFFVSESLFFSVYSDKAKLLFRTWLIQVFNLPKCLICTGRTFQVQTQSGLKAKYMVWVGPNVGSKGQSHKEAISRPLGLIKGLKNGIMHPYRKWLGWSWSPDLDRASLNLQNLGRVVYSFCIYPQIKTGPGFLFLPCQT